MWERELILSMSVFKLQALIQKMVNFSSFYLSFSPHAGPPLVLCKLTIWRNMLAPNGSQAPR